MADSTTPPEWPKEIVPDHDELYFRVHRTFLKRDGTVGTSAFTDRGSAMSTDWSMYATPSETRDRARRPADNGVMSLGVGRVRAVPLTVEHDPLPLNRAHTHVIGEKTPEVRVHLRRLAAWEIKVGNEP